MNISISNIAWSRQYDDEIYGFMRSNGFTGLEIAPTAVFRDKPYECLSEAAAFADMLKKSYGFCISSIQSIWYGRKENMFGTSDERASLITYTKQAVNFAVVVGSENLVFGCPKNRNMPRGANIQTAYDFLAEIAEYAAMHSVVIAFEPNPPIYGTNFINRTSEAFDICKSINSPGLKTNIDLGTCIFYGEDLAIVAENIELVNHIHISEPMLAPIIKRDMHSRLQDLDYRRFMSIEMQSQDDINVVKRTITYIGELLG
jgi:sugar phosphate isomerase/epimerase